MLKKLFRVLVIGGSALVGTHCGPAQQQNPPNNPGTQPINSPGDGGNNPGDSGNPGGGGGPTGW